MKLPINCTLLAAALVLAASPLTLAQETGHGHHAHQHAATPVASITTVDYAFEAPDTFPAGWNTFRFVNEGEEPHIVFLLRLPEGKAMEDYQTQVLPHFGAIYDALRAGELDYESAVPALMQKLPEWYFGVQPMGGAGFAVAGVSSEVTLNLEPGNYLLECYLKTADGRFHIMEGMMRPLVVTEERSMAGPPEPTLHVRLSNAGLDVGGDLKPGRHVVAVHFEEHPEMGLPHDVNVVRLDEDTSIEEVVGWMNWMSPAGLLPVTPARFIGGARPMPAGHTSYFTVDLEPGRYLFVSENTGYQGVLKEVRIKQ